MMFHVKHFFASSIQFIDTILFFYSFLFLPRISFSPSFQFTLHFISSFFLFLPNSHPTRFTRNSAFFFVSIAFSIVFDYFARIFTNFRRIQSNLPHFFTDSAPILQKNSMKYLRFYRSPRFTRCILFI